MLRLVGLTSFFSLLYAQVLVGGVTDTSALLYIWDAKPWVTVSGLVDTLLEADSLPIRLTLAPLRPATHYVYEVKLTSGLVVSGSFHTPPLSPLRVVALSCDVLDPKLKAEKALKQYAAQLNPHLILHLGDWGYPDTTEKEFPPKTDHFFPYKWEYLRNLYEKRYLDPTAYKLRTIASWAYLYDDHDFVADNTGQDYRAQYRTLSLPIGDYPFVPALRERAMKAYEDLFPHYPLPLKEKALLQHFRWGDVEFFFLDNRSARTGTMKVFELGELGRHYFRPKPEISILGREQMAYLKQALLRSTARWKVILSGVTYNRNLQLFIRQALNLPAQTLRLFGGLYKVPGIFIAGFIADTWAGYPADQDSLLSWCWAHQIRGVVFVSGDTHVATLEDGAMGGFPELMTGGAGKTERRSYLLAKKLGISIFNTGGQGITRKDFSTALGCLVFQGDSLWLFSLNHRGDTLAKLLLTADILPLPPSLWPRLEHPNLGLTFFVQKRQGRMVSFRWAKPEALRAQSLRFSLYTAQGERVWQSPAYPAKVWKKLRQLELPETLPSGYYFLRAETDQAYFGCRLRL